MATVVVGAAGLQADRMSKQSNNMAQYLYYDPPRKSSAG